MNEDKKFVIILFTCILISIIFLMFNIYYKSPEQKLNQTLNLECQKYNFTQLFYVTSSLTLFDSYEIKDIHLLNKTNSTFYCEADTKMCISYVYTCFDTSLISNELNYTFKK